MSLRTQTPRKLQTRHQVKVKLMQVNMANRECLSLYKPASPQLLKSMLSSLKDAKDSYKEMPTDPKRKEELLNRGRAVKDFIMKLSQVIKKHNN